jgi:hypothetical protein
MRKPIQTFIKTETFKAIEEMAKEQHTSNYKVAQHILEQEIDKIGTAKKQNGFSAGETRPNSIKPETKGTTHNPFDTERDGELED